jgi:hypothetical protein
MASRMAFRWWAPLLAGAAALTLATVAVTVCQTLIEHWNRKRWKVLPGPNPPSGYLAGEHRSLCPAEVTAAWADSGPAPWPSPSTPDRPRRPIQRIPRGSLGGRVSVLPRNPDSA